MNLYTIVTADDLLDCSDADFSSLREAMRKSEARHGFDCLLENKQVFIRAEECGTPEELPKAALNLIAKLLRQNKRKFLEFGVALTGDRAVAETCGGYRFRIWDDGEIEFQETLWKRKS